MRKRFITSPYSCRSLRPQSKTDSRREPKLRHQTGKNRSLISCASLIRERRPFVKPKELPFHSVLVAPFARSACRIDNPNVFIGFASPTISQSLRAIIHTVPANAANRVRRRTISVRCGDDLVSASAGSSKTFTIGISFASSTFASSYCFDNVS